MCAESCPTLCDPVDSSPHGLLCPWNFPGKNSRVGCYALLQRIFLTQTLKLVSWIAGRFFTPEPSGKPRQWLKSRHHFFVQGLYGQSYGFSCSYVCMWELDYKEGWALKNWYFQIVVLEKTLENCLDFKEIKPENPKINQPLIFIGRIDAEAPILWHLMQRADSLGKTLILGKNEGKRRRGQQRMR